MTHYTVLQLRCVIHNPADPRTREAIRELARRGVLQCCT